MSEIVVTPLKIHLIDINKDIYLSIFSGILGVSQDPESLCVKPELGFLITKQLNDKKILLNIKKKINAYHLNI
jgi:hypothetical protein